MKENEIERHILRAVYELELVKDDYQYSGFPDVDRIEFFDNTVEMLKHYYPNVKEELEKETWK